MQESGRSKILRTASVWRGQEWRSILDFERSLNHKDFEDGV